MLTDYSAVALSKLYQLNDPRLAEVQVKGDLIVPKSDRIMTRSRARQTPDQYTIIPAQLKIIKVLVAELLSASGNDSALGGGSAHRAGDDDDEDGDDGEWEDDGDFVDMASGLTKSQLMAYANDDGPSHTRGRDDETQAYLVGFFRQVEQEPSFAEVFNALTAEEQQKLRTMSA